MLSFERFHQNCQANLAAVCINGLKGEENLAGTRKLVYTKVEVNVSETRIKNNNNFNISGSRNLV